MPYNTLNFTFSTVTCCKSAKNGCYLDTRLLVSAQEQFSQPIAEAYLEANRTSKKGVFCKKSQLLSAVNYFHKTPNLRCLTWL